MAYSAELIVSGETYTANVLKGNTGDTGPRGLDGKDGVGIISVYDSTSTLLTTKLDRINFTGGGLTVTSSGNTLTINAPVATNDYNQLINKPTQWDFNALYNVPLIFSGNYVDLTNKPTIPTDVSELTDTQGILSEFTFDGSYTSLTGIPSWLTVFDGSYAALTGKPLLFSGNYQDLQNLPTLITSYSELTDLPDLDSLNYVTPQSLSTTLAEYVTTTILNNTITSALVDYAKTSVLSNYVTTTTLTNYVTTTALNQAVANYVTTSQFNTTIAAYVLTSDLQTYASKSYVSSAIAQLVDLAPSTLDTLNELAAALGDDANFFTNVYNAIDLKANTSALSIVATSGNYEDLINTPPTFADSLAGSTTTDLTEGTNLYYTEARVQAKLGNISGNIIPDTNLTYDLGSSTNRFKDLYLSGNSIYLGDVILSNDSGNFVVVDGDGNPVTISLANNTTTNLAEGTNLYYTTDRANTDFDARLLTKDTDALAEGTNLYYTTDRANTDFDARLLIKTTTDLTEGNNFYFTNQRVYDAFDIHLLTKTTANLAEGSNLYYTTARANTDFDARILTKNTGDLEEGTNLYYTDQRSYIAFDARLLTKTTADLAEGSNLYYTTDRANIDFDDRLLTKTTADLVEGTNLYYTTARANTDFDARLLTKDTGDIAEGVNLYYTDARADARIAAATTDDLSEGVTNLYYTEDRVKSNIDSYLSGGIGVSVTPGASTSTISIGQDVSTSSNVTFNNITANGNVQIDGNLTVSGTTVTINATNLAVEDNMIYLNNGSTTSNPDLGFAGNYNDGIYSHTGLFRDATDGVWKFYDGYTPEPDASAFIDTDHESFRFADVQSSRFIGPLTGDVTGNVTGNVTGQVSSISNHSTSNLVEGSRLYYTTARANADFDNRLTTKTTNDVAEGANLYWTTARGQAMFDSRFAIQTTSNLAEGANLYWTTARGNLMFDNRLASKTTNNLVEGSNNLYYTTARVNAAFDAKFDLKTTGDLLEGSNLYWTVARGQAMFDTRFTTKTTDNLAEGSSNLFYTDARVNAVFGTKTTTQIPEGENLYYTTARVNIDFDNRLAAKTTNNLTEGTNLYYTTTRVNSAFDTRLAIKTTDNLAEGSNRLYYTEARVNTNFASKTTSQLAEGANLYYTDLRVQNKIDSYLVPDIGVSIVNGVVSIGQAVATTSDVTFNNITANGNVQVDGNLTVTGDTFQVNVTNLEVADNFIRLNSADELTEPDLGLSGNYNSGSLANAGLFRDATDGIWKFYEGYTPAITAYIDTSHVSFSLAEVQAARFNGPLTGAVTGNATSASKWASPRSVTFGGGDVTGTFEIDGSSNVSGIALTIEPNSVALGTDTTGAYVSSLVAGVGVTLLNNAGESATPTIAIGQSVETTDSVTFDTVTANLIGNVTGNVTGTVSSLSNQTTTDLTEGTNLYYTDTRVNSYLVNNSYATQSYVGESITTASVNYATAAQGLLADTALQSVAFSDLTSTPTTLAGYGITDAATSAQGALADTALQSVAFSDLTSTPTTLADYGITDSPTEITDLGITDGTAGQILTTDGAGNFTFQDPVVAYDDTDVASYLSTNGYATSADTIASITGTGTGSIVFSDSPTLTTPVASIVYGSVSDGGSLSLRSTTSATKGTIGVKVDDTIESTSLTSGALVVTGGVAVGKRLSASEIYAERITEKITTSTSAVQDVISFSYLNGTTYYNSGLTGNFIPNFTNVPTTNNRSIVFVIVVEQGLDGVYPTGVKIDGSDYAVKWVSNLPAVGYPLNIDMYTFTLIRANSTWKVLVNQTTYGDA